MGDDSKTYDIVIQTRAAGDGARQTTEELNKTADAAERVAKAGTAQPIGGAPAQVKTANELLEEQRKLQQDIIVAKLRAADAGDNLTVDKLREEIGIRAEILTEIQEAGTNVQRVNWLITQQNELIQESNAAVEAQAAAMARAAAGPAVPAMGREFSKEEMAAARREREADQAQMTAAMATTGKANEEDLSAQQKKLVLYEKQALTEVQRAQIEAAIAGDQTLVKKLVAEQAIRNMTVRTLQQEVLDQARLNEFIAEQTALIERSNTAVAARAAAEEAEGKSKVYGRAGHLGHLLENFGIGENFAVLSGMGLMFGMEANRLVKERAEHINKINEENEKAGEAATERLQKTREELEDAHSLSDVFKIQGKLHEDLLGLYKRREKAEGEELEQINLQIKGLEASARYIEVNWKKASERKTAEQQIKEEIEGQNAALAARLKIEDKLVSEMDSRLRREKELRDAQLQSNLAKVDAAEKAGKITHEQAARARANLESRAADKTSRDEIDRLSASKSSMERKAADLEAAKAEADRQKTITKAEAEMAAKSMADWGAAQSIRTRLNEAEKLLGEAQDERKRWLGTFSSEAGAEQAFPEKKKELDDKVAQAKASTDALNAQLATREAGFPKGKSAEQLQRDANEKAAAAKLAEESAKKAEADAQKAEELRAKATETGNEIANKRAVQAANQKTRETTVGETIAEARAKDVEIKLRAELARIDARLKSMEDSGKRNPEYADDVRKRVEIENRMLAPRGLPAAGAERALIVAQAQRNFEAGEERIRRNNQLGQKQSKEELEITSGISSAAGQADAISRQGWQNGANQALRDAAAAARKNPADAQLMVRLVAAIQGLIGTYGLGDEQKRAAMQELERKVQSLEQAQQRLQGRYMNGRSTGTF